MSTVAPVVTEATADQTSYAPGAKVTITLHYTPGASETTATFTGTATDETTGQVGSLQGTFNVLKPDPSKTSVSDSDGRTYTLVSDNGSVAVYEATA